MKKVLAFLISVAVCFGVLFGLRCYYQISISKSYFEKFAEDQNANKFKSIVLQNMGLSQKDDVFVLGSSELEASAGYFSHPLLFFDNKREGFQVNLVGRAGYTCLVQAVNLGALGDNVKGKKIVLILSPQWFTPKGVDQTIFEASTSELQLYGFLFDRDISLETKGALAGRIKAIMAKKPNEQYSLFKNYCFLYTKNNFSAVAERNLLAPYFWMRFELLILKDDINSYHYLKSKPAYASKQQTGLPKIDWDMELKKAETIAASRATNNSFGMENEAYKIATKDGLENMKGYLRNSSYRVSREYDDLKIFLEVCKQRGIKPLIVSIPVNGKWYDFAGTKAEERQAYYHNIKEMVDSYGFDLADFSGHEYDTYFLKDASHLGWKGWVYVDKAIDEYYCQK